MLWVDSPEREALMKDNLRNYDTAKAALDTFIAKDKENAQEVLTCDICDRRPVFKFNFEGQALCTSCYSFRFSEEAGRDDGSGT